MGYPAQRLRRLRQSEAFRRLIRETRVSVDQLVMPLFVRPGTNVRAPIPSMPGQFQFSVDQLVKECQELRELCIPAVLLFGIPQTKDEKAGSAYAKDGIVQQAVHAVKSKVPELAVITDVCLCAYTSHGHCGIVKLARGSRLEARGSKGKRSRLKARGSRPTLLPSAYSLEPTAKRAFSLQPSAEGEFIIDNDATLELLAKTAVSHAQAGADMVAPSDMMDGRVRAIRQALDAGGWAQVSIMSYAAKYASQLYGPFREAVKSSPEFGDRKSYQMDVANVEEALREVALDIEEGADIVMVKPALGYLDVIYRIKQRFGHPVAAFNVSGEYAMVKAASARGWLMERSTWLEMLLAMRRAGADLIITYWAKDAAKFLREK